MSINPPTGSGAVLPLQQFAPQSYTPTNDPSPQAGNDYSMLATVQPPSASPPGSAVTVTAATATTTGVGTPAGGQTGAVSRQLTSFGAYLPNLPPAAIPATADSGATPGTPSPVAYATNAAAARQYMAGSGSTSGIVSNTMIC